MMSIVVTNMMMKTNIQIVMYKVRLETMKVKILMMFMTGVKKIQIEFDHY